MIDYLHGTFQIDRVVEETMSGHYNQKQDFQEVGISIIWRCNSGIRFRNFMGWLLGLAPFVFGKKKTYLASKTLAQPGKIDCIQMA